MSATPADTYINILKNMKEKTTIGNTCGHTETTLNLSNHFNILKKCIKQVGLSHVQDVFICDL